MTYAAAATTVWSGLRAATTPWAHSLRNPAQIGVAAFLGAPIMAGLVLTLAPAFGYLPALGGHSLSLSPWVRLFNEPGILSTLRLTVSVGLAATLGSLALALGLLATIKPRAPRPAWQEGLAPLLASPHSAIAIGLAFLLAPSGMIVRLLSPWATGLTAPPDIATVNDPLGIALTVGLIVKETPFLLLVAIGALGQFPAQVQLNVARSLGHAPAAAWLKIVAPQVLARIRLPVYAVLAYSLSNVDMALVLAPSHPPTLSELGLRWLLSPDLADVFPGAAAAVLQMAIVLGAIAFWRMGEIAVRGFVDAVVRTGQRGAFVSGAIHVFAAAGWAALLAGFASLLMLTLWSFAWRWPFPLALPESWSIELPLRQAVALARPLGATLGLAVLASAASLAAAIAWLESDDRRGARSNAAWVYVPLLLPQLGFLFGVQTFFATMRLDGTFVAVAWAHALFVFPYVMLALSDSWAGLDPRYARAASALGAGPMAILARIKLPLLLRPLLAAFAIGFAVSVSQYLATIFAGGGRVATLTTEALALAGGGDRRLAAVAGLAQAALPFVVYLAALVLPRLVFSNRRGVARP